MEKTLKTPTWKKVESFDTVVNILDPRALSKVAAALETALARLGINVKMNLELKKERNGNPYIEAQSTAFNTFPVMFKEVKVQGYFNILELEEKREGDCRFKINCCLDYRWYHFRGGENGTSLGYTEIVYVKNDWDEDGGDVLTTNFQFGY